MTIPRVLGLKNRAALFYNDDTGFDETTQYISKLSTGNKIKLQVPYKIDFNIPDLHTFTVIFSDSSGQELRIGFDEDKNAFFIDRTNAEI